MWKKDTTRCLDVVKFLPTVPSFPHTFDPRIIKSIIYLDKGPNYPSYNLKPNFQSHPSSSQYPKLIPKAQAQSNLKSPLSP